MKFYLCIILNISICFSLLAQSESNTSFQGCGSGVIDLTEISSAGSNLFILHLPNNCYDCSLPISQIESLRQGEKETKFFLAIPTDGANLTCQSAKSWLQSKGLDFFTILKYPKGYNPAPTAALVYTFIKPGELGEVAAAEEILPEPIPDAVDPAVEAAENDEQLNLGPVEFAITDFYPNPFEDLVTLNFSTPQEENMVVRVLDIVGNEVYNGVFCINEEKSEVSFLIGDKDRLNSGVYLLRVELEDKVETLRLFKD